jgi:hypothetical protein
MSVKDPGPVTAGTEQSGTAPALDLGLDLGLDTEIGPEKPDAARRVRAGTIVWGFLLFAIAALFFAGAQLDLSKYDGMVITTWVVLIVGALTLLGGILGALLHRLRH